MRTTDSIIANLTKMVAEKQPITPEMWLESSQYLNILLLEDINKAIELEQAIARIESEFVESGDTSAKAKTKVKALSIWVEWRKLSEKIKMVQGHILIAKKQATVAVALGA
jgi:hypothetical protein